MSCHCKDVKYHRALGNYWEEQFCGMMTSLGLLVTPHQARKRGAAVALADRPDTPKTVVLPDVSVWDNPSYHHEVKHKEPARNGCYGLELYRFKHLLLFAKETNQKVYYTVHNHRGFPDTKDNILTDWVTASVTKLEALGYGSSVGHSFCDGESIVSGLCYFPKGFFDCLLTPEQIEFLKQTQE